MTIEEEEVDPELTEVLPTETELAENEASQTAAATAAAAHAACDVIATAAGDIAATARSIMSNGVSELRQKRINCRLGNFEVLDFRDYQHCVMVESGSRITWSCLSSHNT